jgi:cytochrome c-type biogenesis protein CcmH/NrfF
MTRPRSTRPRWACWAAPPLGLLTADAVVIAEHRRKAEPRQRLEDRYGALERTRLLEQGDAALSFYAVSCSSAQQ